ncbi:DUF1217 domain-containing protein [Sagittula salina]|nr:DUF1217 domain-containing protein [Sagittula salina]
MPITPMIAGSGLIGYQVLQTTLTSQQKAFNASADVARDAKYFLENIGSVSSGDELVENRSLLRVALSAFGLSDQIDSTYLLKRVLSEGVEDDKALANKLNDGRYVALANAFNFEETVAYPFQEDGFADTVLAAYDKKIRSDLQGLLAEPEYSGNPIASAALETSVLDALEITSQHFRDNIGSVGSVDDLFSDPDLLKVALGAFGVEDRINSKTLLKRVFSEGADDPDALANVLKDKGLIAMTKAFGFNTEPSTALQAENFAEKIIDNYQWQLFEDAIYEIDPTIGTAMSFQRAAPALAGLDSSENTKWFNVLGDSMMREVFEKALGLPAGFSQIDIDKQLEVLKEKAESRFGIASFSDLEDEKVQNKVIFGYLLQAEIANNASYGSQQIALTLLSSMRQQNQNA